MQAEREDQVATWRWRRASPRLLPTDRAGMLWPLSPESTPAEKQHVTRREGFLKTVESRRKREQLALSRALDLGGKGVRASLFYYLSPPGGPARGRESAKHATCTTTCDPHAHSLAHTTKPCLIPFVGKETRLTELNTFLLAVQLAGDRGKIQNQFSVAPKSTQALSAGKVPQSPET